MPESTPIIDGDTRKPIAGFLNYKGRINTPIPYAPKGPNTMGELLWPVSIDYVTRDGVEYSRVGFAYTAPVLDYMTSV